MLKGISGRLAEAERKQERAIRSRTGSGRCMFFLLGMACMALLQTLWPVFRPAAGSPSAVLQTGTGPTEPTSWVSNKHEKCGEFEYVNLPLREPREFLPDTTRPLGAPRWFFPKDYRKAAETLFATCDLDAEQKASLLAAKNWQVVSNGFYVFPPPEVVLEMSPRARERIYSVLDDYPANSAQCHPFRFRPEKFEEWLADTGLGPDPCDLLRKLLYREGGTLCFCDTALAQGLFSAQDFNRLVEALYGERTFLMRLRITPQTDLEALLRYWGQAGHGPFIRPLLESLAQVPGGSVINISMLLPPFARLRLYTYANPANNPTGAAENCFWTAMNFFNEEPDNRFLDFSFVEHVLATDYEQITGTPTFGDVLSLCDAKGGPIHMCVYLADDVVFTKNGHDYIEPWVLMKIPDMLAAYQAKAPTRLEVFRSKNRLSQQRPFHLGAGA